MDKSYIQPILPEVGVLALVKHEWSPQWMAPHHVLARLARYFTVLWENPPSVCWQDSLARSHSRQYDIVDRALSPGFEVHFPRPWLPNVYHPQWLTDLTFRRRLADARRNLQKRGCNKIILSLWHPDFEAALRFVPHDLSCYHIDDEFTFSECEMPLGQVELNLLSSVNRVFVVSPGLFAKKGKINPNTELAPMGVDFRSYAYPTAEPPDFQPIPHPRIGYTGWLKRQVNWDLLLELALRHREWSFVFVGKRSPHPEIAQVLAELSRCPNVYFMGTKRTEDLASYTQHFDVCIMPYRVNDYTKYIYPLKLHEYLATGHPVVGSRIRSLEDFSDVISLVDTPEDWSKGITNALGPEANSATLRAARKAVARQYDWDVLVSRIALSMARGLNAEIAKKVEQSLDRYTQILPDILPLSIPR